MGHIRGERVEWNWGDGTGEREVGKTYTQKITRNLQGSEVMRNGPGDDPALDIEQEDGDGVPKVASEVRKA